MTTLYKLTTQDNKTAYNTLWELNKRKKLPKVPNPKLCSKSVFHSYKSIELALLLNPIHADIANPKLWEAEGNIVVESWDKVGSFNLTLVKELPYPKWYKDKDILKKVQIQFAVLCAKEVLPLYQKYNSKDTRVEEAIKVAEDYLKGNAADAAYDAAYAAATAARSAAYDAADAAYAAAYAAARAARAARAAANDAHAAAYDAAYAAAAAAYDAAAAADAKINIESLAKKAIKIITGE